jgi:hypothetical protein
MHGLLQMKTIISTTTAVKLIGGAGGRSPRRVADITTLPVQRPAEKGSRGPFSVRTVYFRFTHPCAGNGVQRRKEVVHVPRVARFPPGGTYVP